MSYIMNQDIPVGSALNQLGSLLDVNINNPQNGDTIVYNSTTGKWENEKIIQPDYVYVTADGTKTYRQLANELYALVDKTKLTYQSVLIYKYNNADDTQVIFPMTEKTNTYLVFAIAATPSGGARATAFTLTSSASEFFVSTGNTRVDNSTLAVTNGVQFEIHY